MLICDIKLANKMAKMQIKSANSVAIMQKSRWPATFLIKQQQSYFFHLKKRKSVSQLCCIQCWTLHTGATTCPWPSPPATSSTVASEESKSRIRFRPCKADRLSNWPFLNDLTRKNLTMTLIPGFDHIYQEYSCHGDTHH